LVHFRLVKDFFPSDVVACVLRFMQFAEQGSNQLQKNILDRLHDHFFSNIIFDMVTNFYHTLEVLCGPKGEFLVVLCLVISPFHTASNFFSFMLHTRLGLPHFSFQNVSLHL